jgi:hypothetical protein
VVGQRGEVQPGLVGSLKEVRGRLLPPRRTEVSGIFAAVVRPVAVGMQVTPNPDEIGLDARVGAPGAFAAGEEAEQQGREGLQAGLQGTGSACPGGSRAGSEAAPSLRFVTAPVQSSGQGRARSAEPQRKRGQETLASPSRAAGLRQPPSIDYIAVQPRPS